MYSQYKMEVLNTRNTWIEIDLSILRDNFKKIDRHVKKSIIPVIKANAYSHGTIAMGKLYERLGVPIIAVAALDEALEMRRNGVMVDILVLGYVDLNCIQMAIDENFILTSADLDWTRKVNAYAEQQQSSIRIHIKLNCGMNRRGFKSDDEVKEVLTSFTSLKVEGIFGHLSSADIDEEETYAQIETFESRVASYEFSFDWIHLSNSFSASLFEQKMRLTNAVRPGLLLYGYYDEVLNIGVKPALSLFSESFESQTLQRGEGVSYGLTYKANSEEYINIFPIGYADGILRHFQGETVFTEEFGFCEIVGRICMDQLAVKVPKPMSNLKIEIIGKNISINRLAEKQSTIIWEILCQLSARIQTRYIGELYE